MAIDQGQMLQAIYDAIFDALTTNPSGLGGGRPVLPRATSYLMLVLPGNPVDITQFANAWSPDNPTGGTQQAENFANLVDPAPVLNPVYQSSGQSIDDLYGEIVRANVKPQPPDPEAQAAVDRANQLLFVDGTDFDDQGRPITVPVPSPFYANYMRKMGDYEDALATYTATYLQYDLSNPADARKWSILGPVIQRPVDRAWAALQSTRPGVIEAALATLGQFQQSSVERLFSDARQLYDQTRRASVSDPGFFWHVCNAMPANWFAESAASNLTQITIRSERVRLSEDSRFTSYRGGAGVNLGLWRVGADVSGHSQQSDMSSDTSSMEISFRFGRVEFQRRWLRAQLLSLHGWSTAGRNPGDYSDGNPTNNPGIFPLLTTSFIIARDLKISANWGHADLQVASKSIDVSASVGWGPFSLSGGYSNSSSSRRFKSDFDGTTISCPALNIVAWIATIVPFCPPTGGPPAQPEEERRRIAAKRRNPYTLPYAAPILDPKFEEIVYGVRASSGRSLMPSASAPVAAPSDVERPASGRSPVLSAPAPVAAPSDVESEFVSAEGGSSPHGTLTPAAPSGVQSEFVSTER